jgi:uncharacterized protein (TIGR02246 family)
MATQVMSTRQVLDHHLQALGSGQVDEILKDYTEDSMLVIPDAAIKGRAGIRSAFDGFVAGIFKPGTYDLTMDTVRVEGDVAYVIWHAKCASADVTFATDTFIVRDGKIAVQTFAAKIDPR